MSMDVLKKIKTLPPLPKSFKEIEEFRQKKDKEIDDLLKIIEKDALVTSNILKIANSAMFGFRNKVETPSRAINLLGINFAVSIAISGKIKDLLKADLSPYGISSDDFMKTSNISITLANLWLSKISFDLKEELLLPTLLQETAKFILSDLLKTENKSEKFHDLLSQGYSTSQGEKELLGFSTSKITAEIFRHWNLSDNLINSIEYVDDLSKVNSNYKHKAQILDVIKTACEVTNPLSDANVEKAINKAKSYSFNTNILEKAINSLKNRILDEK